MAFVDSSSTIAQIVAAIADNVSYDLPGDITKAREFAAAVRLMLLKFPKMSSQDRASVEYDQATLKEMLDDALSWLASNDTTSDATDAFGSIKHADLAGFRT